MVPQPDSSIADKVYPSPNHGERAGGVRPSVIVLHYTGMMDAGTALQRLVNPVSQVSCHYFVFENGRILQLVPEARRAWHAGKGSWDQLEDMNSHSIGIEIANPGHEHGYVDFPEPQMEAVTRLCADLADRHAIRPHRVIAHSDMAPTRKEDPGEKFDWARLAATGVGLYHPPAPIRGGRFLSQGDRGATVRALQDMFAMLGYAIERTGDFDPLTHAVTMAFQRHWRQSRVDGVADMSTIDTLRALVDCRLSERGPAGT